MTPFLSDAWFKILEREAQRLAMQSSRSDDKTDFSYIEIINNAPEPRRDGRLVGFRMDFKGRQLRVRSGISPDEKADMWVEADYSIAVRTTDIPSGPALDQIVVEATNSGLIKMRGNSDAMPISMLDLHDAILKNV